jgi:hypothetical protein
VALLVPPGGQLAYPTLAPASLKGYLGRYGAEVDLFDLNVVAFHDLLSDDGLAHLYTRLGKQETHLRQAFADQPEVLHQLAFLQSLTAAQRNDLRGIPDRIRDVDLFCHETAYAEVMHHLSQYVRLVELAFHPLQFLPGSLIGGMFGRIRDFDTLMSIETPYDASVDRQLSGVPWARYQVIGMSAFSFDQLIFALRLSELLRTLAPDAVTVLGGNTLTESEVPEQLRSILAQAFDVVVIGDGELPLLRTVEYACGRRRLDEIPNAFFRVDDEVVETGRTYRYQFEGDCAPDFDGFPHHLYQLPVPVLPFRFSNGCEWGRCTFCSESADRGPVTSRLTYREVPTDRVAAHLSSLHDKYGASIFINCSSLITAAGCVEIADAIRRHELRFQWFAMVRAENAFTLERVAAAAAGGASTLNFGIESFDRRINRLMKKGIDVRRAPDILSSFRREGTTVTCYTLANFPSETLDEFGGHLAVVEDNIEMFDVLFKSNFMMVTEAPVFEDPVQFGVRAEAAGKGRYERMKEDPFPIYLIPDERSGTADFRWPDDRLEDKLDLYHRMLLRVAMNRPLYFARHYEIASHDLYWEPEYNMIIKELGRKRFLPGLSLGDLARLPVRIAPGVVLERVSPGSLAVTVPWRTIRLYYGPFVSRLLELLSAGSSFGDALNTVVHDLDPTPLDLLDLYEQVHRDLRHLGVVEVLVSEASHGENLLEAASSSRS